MGAAHDLAARDVQFTIVRVRLLQGADIPVLLAVPQLAQVKDLGHVWVGVIRPAFDNRDGLAGIDTLAQYYISRRTRPSNDEIKLLLSHEHPPKVCCVTILESNVSHLTCRGWAHSASTLSLRAEDPLVVVHQPVS